MYKLLAVTLIAGLFRPSSAVDDFNMRSVQKSQEMRRIYLQKGSEGFAAYNLEFEKKMERLDKNNPSEAQPIRVLFGSAALQFLESADGKKFLSGSSISEYNNALRIISYALKADAKSSPQKIIDS